MAYLELQLIPDIIADSPAFITSAATYIFLYTKYISAVFLINLAFFEFIRNGKKIRRRIF